MQNSETTGNVNYEGADHTVTVLNNKNDDRQTIIIESEAGRDRYIKNEAGVYSAPENPANKLTPQQVVSILGGRVTNVTELANYQPELLVAVESVLQLDIAA